MKAPVKHVTWGGAKKGGSVRYELPDKEWLHDQYVVQEKSPREISREFGIGGGGGGTVRRWLEAARIQLRSRLERDERHAQRMSGEGNPAYVDGTDRGGSSRRCRNILWDANVPEVCSFCGVPVEEERLEAHHRDHNRRNEAPKNLMWLCPTCHKLETWIWKAQARGKAVVEAKGDTITIRFPHLSET